MIYRLTSLLLLLCITAASHAQKGDKNITAGPLLSLPLRSNGFASYMRPGVGLQATGAYGFTNRSAALLQLTFATHGTKAPFGIEDSRRLNLLLTQAGYRLSVGSGGFFGQALLGIETDLHDGFTTAILTLGGGKRFSLQSGRYIDAGVDYINGDTEPRLNLRVAVSLFPNP